MIEEKKNKTIFERLNEVNVNEHTEKKNGLTYLPWAYAWGEVKKVDDKAIYTVYENANGWNYHTDGRTCWVKCGVTVGGHEHIEYLAVMDYKNKAIPLDAVTSCDVVKSIQRALTKACARHGIGLYIYAGEDLPEGEEPVNVPKIKKVTVTPEQVAELEAELQRTGARWNPATVKADLDVKTWEHYMSVLRAKPDKEEEA